MAVPKETVWKIEPHTATKHLILRQYLNAWLPMVSTYHGRIVFIDGFAGPGRYKDGEPGSPIIVLTTLLNHRYFRQPRRDREFVFVFIEKDKPRAQALEAELVRLAKERVIPDWVKYGVEQDEFADVITRALDDLEKKGDKLAPTLLFVDPFGFSDAPLEVIARVTKSPKCECLITFMFDSIRRWLPHRDFTIAAHFDLLFGTKDWRTLLDEPGTRRHAGILTLYRDQLMNVAGLKYVRTFEMLNNRNRPIYSLFFGTNHKEGLSKMKEAMWKAD
ncbi:MAG: three-Cys-motif partner protein TcmP, partial [Armatimonadota bacterium]